MAMALLDTCTGVVTTQKTLGEHTVLRITLEAQSMSIGLQDMIKEVAHK